MELDPDICYTSLLAKDRRFDGWFFVGVSSTGIYCRPVCAVRAPQRRNCHFFGSAAAAEDAGYRPCLRCRPELAPARGALIRATADPVLGVASAPSHLADAAAALIVEGFLNHRDVEALAARMGVTQRHLRRLFQAAYGVSIVAFAQTQRLLMAKRLLTDTALPVTAIAHASGFGSVRRSNDLFQQRYGLSPGRLRKQAPYERSPTVARTTAIQAAPPLVLPLAYRPPYAWTHLLGFLRRRAIPGVEYADGERYARTLSWPAPGRADSAVGERNAGGDAQAGSKRAAMIDGWFSVTHAPHANAIIVHLSPSLTPVLTQVLPCIRRVFDLDAQPDRIDAHLGELAHALPGIRVPGAVDGFEMGVRAILGQLVSVAQCVAKLGRFVDVFGHALPDDPHRPAALTRRFPTAATVHHALHGLSSDAQADRLCPIGMTRMRARAIVAFARALTDKAISVTPLSLSGAPLPDTLAALQALPGIGAWTAQYIAMRALGWPNAWPEGDGILLKQTGCSSAAALREHVTRWAPWRAYAAMHLWRLAGDGDTPSTGPSGAMKTHRPTRTSRSREAQSLTPFGAAQALPIDGEEDATI
ncbi:DNA-3-methyladenine glycosylase 2 family protein [Robbsia andropogonis]|uniref:DNA-3-methyladenine glycosylase 2 family protein n=1 Tax=Robbsia andropogonis TaxID=28092 RepID=UPI003D25A8C7